MRYDINDIHIKSLHIKINIQYRTTPRQVQSLHTHHIMTNIIKRIISKRTKVKTFEYTDGSESIPKNVTHIHFHSSVTEVHDEAFRGCSKLKEVVFSDGITTIGDGSFKGCKRLKRVVLNYGLKQIGDDAFANCISLDSITFPSTVTKIGDRAFEECSSLKQIIHMNEGVGIKYGWDVFHGCQLWKLVI